MAIDPYVAATREGQPRRRASMPPAKPWRADRPGDIDTHHPQGGSFGHQGPDQGYAFKLAGLFEDRASLVRGERWEDVEYGVAEVACRRASSFGRAPIKDDVELGLLAWGFLTEGVPPQLIDALVAARRPLFSDVIHDHTRQRKIAGAVPEGILRMTPSEARARLVGGELLVSLAPRP